MQLAENYWKSPMSTKSSFRAALERRGHTKAKSPARSGFPIPLVLALEDVKQPVEVVRLLKRRGLSLRKAHETLSRLASRETVAVELRAAAPSPLIAELAALGVTAHVIEPPQTDAKRVRERLGLSQAEFALRFGLELATVQNWEQGRYRPDPAAQLALKIIDSHPEVVDEVLAKR
jgi:DNA-binding transcriptional regulator YiaG